MPKHTLQPRSSGHEDTFGRDCNTWPQIWRESRSRALKALRRGGYAPSPKKPLSDSTVQSMKAEIQVSLDQLTNEEIFAVNLLVESLAGPASQGAIDD